jgi:hypothetical protein
MTTYPGSPKLLRGGIVLIDAVTAAVVRVIALQYNPETLSRSLEIKGAGESGDRSEALRLLGPPVETITLEAAIDATDQLEVSNQETRETGLHAQLAALETLVYPTSRQLLNNDSLARSGVLEISPMEAPLALFVWSKSRVVPVRVTSFSITEEAFDPDLNPIRAKVSLGLRVLTVDDLGFDHKGGGLFMTYHQQKERLAAKSTPGLLAQLGLGGVP